MRRTRTGGDAQDGAYDIVVVGAGIVGLATAMRLLERQPNLRLLLIEKEAEVGRHQTSHNSGVIHRGIYYAPGSLKARLCHDGARRLVEFCVEHGIAHREIGKLIVAADESELPALRELEYRGKANGVPGLEWVDRQALPQLEPAVVGAAGLLSPTTAIVDYGEVAAAYRNEVEKRGGAIHLSARVTDLTETAGSIEVRTPSRRWRASLVITCAGLDSDRLAAMTDPTALHELRILPFRGDYYYLRRERVDIVRRLVYPVPDPAFPFLGVHLTPQMDGRISLGPNAVLAFAREGYRRRDVSLGDMATTLTFPGFWRVARRYWRVGLGEAWRDISRHAFASALRRYVPSLTDADLTGRFSGVRAQAIARDGSLVDDFVIAGRPRAIHVRNAPSPAATSALAIADFIGDDALQRLETVG